MAFLEAGRVPASFASGTDEEIRYGYGDNLMTLLEAFIVWYSIVRAVEVALS